MVVGKFVEIGIYESKKPDNPIEITRYYYVQKPQDAEEIYKELHAYLKTICMNREN